jgi:hypothetical protein
VMPVNVLLLASVPSVDRPFRSHPVVHLGHYRRAVPGVARTRPRIPSYFSFSLLLLLFHTDLSSIRRLWGSSSAASAARTSVTVERYNLTRRYVSIRSESLAIIQQQPSRVHGSITWCWMPRIRVLTPRPRCMPAHRREWCVPDIWSVASHTVAHPLSGMRPWSTPCLRPHLPVLRELEG